MATASPSSAPFPRPGACTRSACISPTPAIRSSATNSTAPTKAVISNSSRRAGPPALAARLLLPRHALHSAVLRLPARGLAWQSPLAPDLAAWAGENLLATVRKPHRITPRYVSLRQMPELLGVPARLSRRGDGGRERPALYLRGMRQTADRGQFPLRDVDALRLRPRGRARPGHRSSSSRCLRCARRFSARRKRTSPKSAPNNRRSLACRHPKPPPVVDPAESQTSPRPNHLASSPRPRASTWT